MVLPPFIQTASFALVNAGITPDRIRDFSSIFAGQFGRVIFSLIYFVALARTLDLADFGIFATISAIGIVLSRVSGFGFISPLYRVATTRPLLIGVYTTGYMAAVLASLPLVLLLALGVYAWLYQGFLPVTAFLCIVFAEVIFWRTLESVIIVNYGTNRFLIGSCLAIAGVAFKAVAALWAFFSGINDLATWSLIYMGSNALTAVFAVLFFYPRRRLRWKPRAWAGRARDALGVSAAEALFYIQAEMDKVLVLAFGGEIIAGLYAIIMRIVDLTAMPMRALATMMIQWIMRARQAGESTKTGFKVEALIAFTSISALLAAVVLLHVLPGEWLGENIVLAASYLALLILVPAFRNIIEYHTELLYAHERMVPRVVLLAYLAVMKGSLLILLLKWTDDFATIALWLNVLFGALYVVSAWVTYKRVLNRTL